MHSPSLQSAQPFGSRGGVAKEGRSAGRSRARHREILGFFLPTNFSSNLEGATLYLPRASVFIAQAQGIPLEVKTSIIMMLTFMLPSKGAAGVQGV